MVDSSSTTPNVSRSLYQPGELQYGLQILSIVQAIGGDSTSRTDSSRITGILTASFSAGSRRNVVTAHVQPDSLLLTVGSGTSTPLAITGPFTFAIDTQTGQVVPNANQTSHDCSKLGIDDPPLDGREVLPSIRLPKADTWNDTLQVISCRGGALLTVKRIASYTWMQLPDSAIRLLRLTEFQITGTGYQWGQKIDVSGEGRSIDTLGIAGFPARLQEVRGNSQVNLIFRAPLRTQEFAQTATIRLALRHH